MSGEKKSMSSLNASRRLFLRHAGVMSALGAAGAPLALNLSALGTASAQAASDYKAIVCIFLFGGNDSINMVLPTDAASFANYTTLRSQAPDPIALLAAGTAANAGAANGSPARLGGVLPIAPTNAQGRSFALHPAMGETRPHYTGPKPPYERLDTAGKYSWLKSPRWKTGFEDMYPASVFPGPCPAVLGNHDYWTWGHGVAARLVGPLGLFEMPLYFPNRLRLTVMPRAAMSAGCSLTYITWVRSPESDTSLTPSTRLKESTSMRLA
mgnify:CR=1 FL=1